MGKGHSRPGRIALSSLVGVHVCQHEPQDLILTTCADNRRSNTLSGMSSSEEDANDQELQRDDGDDQIGAVEEHDSSDDDQEERDGRFYGPDSSWRHYTQNERDLAASLDQVQNNDLSIHLYNAHAWKRRHRDVDLFQKSQPWQSKWRWIGPDESGQLPFLPHSGWTAWPLRPEDVPRSREQWGVPLTVLSEEPGTYFRTQPWRPSLNLRDELQAVMLRKAKERFRRRQWHDVGQSSIHLKVRQDSRSSSEYAGESTSPFPKKREDGDIEDETETLDDKKQGAGTPVKNYDPLFTSDDEAAGMILKPTIQHIICKLDDLLLGLHKSRQGHRREPGAPRGRTSSRKKSRSRVQSRTESSNKRKRVASDAIPSEDNADAVLSGSDNDDDDEDEMATPKRSRSSTRHRALGVRDWSEVLGVAALTGWNQAALDRAARRCALTFGETMSVRCMPESSALHLREKVVNYVPEQVPDLDMLFEDEDPGSEDDGEDGAMAFNCCPVADCSRNQEPFEKRWRLREHLKRSHRLSEDEINAMETKSSRWKPDDGGQAVKAETEDDEALLSIPVADRAAVRRDGYLESISISLRNSDNKRRRRKSESEEEE